MSRDTIQQDLVTALLISLIHARLVLVTASFDLREVEFQIETVLHHLTNPDNIGNNVVHCTSALTWDELFLYFQKHVGSGVILRRIDRLSQGVQLQLSYVLMNPDPQMREFVESSFLVCTSSVPTTKLHPFLSRQILVKQNIDLGDDDAVLVELPESITHVEKYVTQMRNAVKSVTIVPELLRYIQDILVFIRTHQLVRVGVPPKAASDFETLVRTLCVLQDRRFATPITVKHAARLTLPAHIKLCAPEDEPSLQYGGDIDVVKMWIKSWDGDVLVDSILEQVPLPK